jgi:hypothetical protein
MGPGAAIDDSSPDGLRRAAHIDRRSTVNIPISVLFTVVGFMGSLVLASVGFGFLSGSKLSRIELAQMSTAMSISELKAQMAAQMTDVVRQTNIEAIKQNIKDELGNTLKEYLDRRLISPKAIKALQRSYQELGK